MASETMAEENDRSDDELRREMVERLKHIGIVKSAVIEEALLAVPRHLFLPGVDRKTAYTDQAVVTHWSGSEPISSASAPVIVALMLEMLDVQPGQRVLEIGAGTGYNAALLGRLVGERGRVVTLDLDDDIVDAARAHIQTAGVENVQVVRGDGAPGWAEGAPYDRIIITAAVNDIFPAWYEQIAHGGRLVMPFSPWDFRSMLKRQPHIADQFLLALEWNGERFECLALKACSFIPLRGDRATRVREVPSDAGPDELSAVLPPGIVARDTFALLQGPVEDETSAVHLSRQDLFGLRVWLALREPDFCEIYVPASLHSGATIPAYLYRNQSFVTAIGLCTEESCCLIKLEEEEDGYPADPRHPLRLAIRRFGKESPLAGRLRTQAETWASAGYPFIWSFDGFSASMPDLYLLAYPRDGRALPEVRKYDTLLNRQHTAFLFTSSASVSTSAGDHVTEPETSESGSSAEDEHLALLKQGKESWNQWRRAHPEIQPRLVDCDLSGMILKEMDLRNAHLNGSNLARADLFGTDLSGADLRGADLRQVRAAGVNLSGADLSGVDLRRVFLVKSSLNGARLCGANLEEASLKDTSLARADLAGASLTLARLTRVNLDGANLLGASLQGLDARETYLPDLDALGDLWYRFRDRENGWRGTVVREEDMMDKSQDFPVGQHPRLIISGGQINIHVQGWDEPVIKVMSQGKLPQLRQEGDTVYLHNENEDTRLLVCVPHIPHGIVKLMQHGGNSITTAVTVKDAHGLVRIEESGRVELRNIGGFISLSAIAGDVVLENVFSEVDLRSIAGSVQARNVRELMADHIEGSLTVEGVENTINCGSVGGNCEIRGPVADTCMLGIGRIGGNARLEGRTFALDCQIGGNAELHCWCWPRPKGAGRVTAGGNLTLYLPAEPDLALNIASGSAISGDGLLLPPSGNFASQVYGAGQARLDITAGGGVRVLREVEADGAEEVDASA